MYMHAQYTGKAHFQLVTRTGIISRNWKAAGHIETRNNRKKSLKLLNNGSDATHLI